MDLSRRSWLAGLTAAAFAQRQSRRPNVLLIMSDDQGYGDLSLHGNLHLKTPNLDQLGRDGVQFRRFCVSPVCAPTRSSLLTGRYNLRCGVWGVTHGKETMRREETTLAEALRAAGYDTALYGKWHLGEHYPYVPHAQGFEEFIGFRTGHWMNYFDSMLERNGKPYATRGYITDAITDHAVQFLERQRASPFFLYVAYNAPHSPFQVPEKYLESFRKADLDDETRAVYAMVSNLDENVGRLLARLEGLGLARDTIVIFLTDNGPNGRRFNAGLRASKGAVYEGGVRAPFFIRWPAGFSGGRAEKTLAAHIDVYPTILDLCGVEPSRGLPVDGMSLAPLLVNRGVSWPDRILYTHREAERNPSAVWPGAARTQRFNLVNGEELYDLASDPGESRNVAREHPDVAKRLRGAYEAWYKVAGEQCGYRRPAIPVGYAEEDPVVLPAPQSYFTGGLGFAGGPGYAHDWITGWTNPADFVHWEIDVARAGLFDVKLRYLCPETDAGTRVAVQSGGARVEAQVARGTPMDPKPSRDVVPRNYRVMHWGELDCGRLALERGEVRLNLTAVEKKGATVADVKEIELRRVG